MTRRAERWRQAAEAGLHLFGFSNIVNSIKSASQTRRRPALETLVAKEMGKLRPLVSPELLNAMDDRGGAAQELLEHILREHNASCRIPALRGSQNVHQTLLAIASSQYASWLTSPAHRTFYELLASACAPRVVEWFQSADSNEKNIQTALGSLLDSASITQEEIHRLSQRGEALKPTLRRSYETAGLELPTRNVPKPYWSASRLLTARNAVVPYVDRGGSLSELLDWARRTEPFLVQILGGAGGTGKTRLATELCLVLTDAPQPWVAGFAVGDVDPAPQDDRPLLIVFDYAETITDQLSRALPRLCQRADTGRIIRVLLLVRRPAPVRASADNGNPWVDATRPPPTLAQAHRDRVCTDEILDEALVTVLDDSPLNPMERMDLFKCAADAFGAEAIQPPSTVDLTLDLYEQPLSIVMSAFLTSRRALVPNTSEALFDSILVHEAHYWVGTWTSQEISMGDEAFRWAVTLATLTDTKNKEDADNLLAAAPPFVGNTSWTRGAVDTWLVRLYVGTPGHTHTYRWGPLEPDRLGEHLVAQHVSDHPQVLAAILAPNRQFKLLLRPLTVLARLASSDEVGDQVVQVLNQRLPQIVERLVQRTSSSDMALDGETLEALALMLDALGPRLSVQVHHDIADMLPRHHPQLASVAVSAARARTKALAHSCSLAPASKMVEVAIDLINSYLHLAIHLGGIGSRVESIDSTTRAVSLARALSADHPQFTRPVLGSALQQHAVSLAHVGRDEDALTCTQEAAGLRRALAVEDPPRHLEALAISVGNLATHLRQLGRHKESEEASSESLNIFRRLAQDEPARFADQLARALMNQAMLEHDPAVKISLIDESLTIWRDLATHSLTEGPVGLVTALRFKARIQDTLGDSNQAMDCMHEAVKLSRCLAERGGAVERVRLAVTLMHAAQLNTLSDSSQELANEGIALAYDNFDAVSGSELREFLHELASLVQGYAVLGQPTLSLSAISCGETLLGSGSGIGRSEQQEILRRILMVRFAALHQLGKINDAHNTIEQLTRLVESTPGDRSPQDANFAQIVLQMRNFLHLPYRPL